MSRSRAFFILAAIAPQLSSASVLFGLTNDNRVISFDSDNPSVLQTNVTLTESGGPTEAMVSLAMRPNGVLYGLGAQGDMFAINPFSGSANYLNGVSLASTSGVSFGMAFDPNAVSQSLRVVSNTRANQRVDVDSVGLHTLDSPLAFAAGDINSAFSPTVNAIAYAGGSLYGIDTQRGALVSLGGNSGAVHTIGNLGVGSTSVDAFCIVAPVLQTHIAGVTGTGYSALQGASGQDSRLYLVNLTFGSAVQVGVIGGNSQVISLVGASTVPEPASLCAIGVGVAALMRRRRSGAR